MSFNSILNTGRQGLYASQSGLTIAGQNIANVNTPGYTRQRLVQASQATGGVTVLGTERLGNSFYSARLMGSTAQLGSSQTQSTNLQQIESILGSTADTGLSASITQFFDALQDLSGNPGGTNERNILSQRSQSMMANFAATGSQLRDLRTQLDGEIRGQVDRVNQLTSELTDLNRQLTGVSTMTLDSISNPGVNNLQDRRDQVISELSTYLNISTVQSDNSSFLLYAGGKLLVEGTNSYKLQAIADPSNDGLAQIVIDAPGQPSLVTNGNYPGGTLGGLLQSRDVHAGTALDEIDRLAAGLVLSLNSVHSQGVGLLDGVSRDLFAGLQITSNGSSRNTGTASVTGNTVLDPTQLSLDDFQIRFTSTTSYQVINTTTGATVATAPYTTGGSIDFAGMRVNISGAPAAGDTFSVNVYSGSATSMSLTGDIQNNAAHIAAGFALGAGQPSAAGDNRNLLSLLDLRGAGQATLGGETFEGYLSATRLRVATAAGQMSSQAEQDGVSQNQVQGMLDSASAVSLDEEAVGILQYQRAFEASSRVISSADELMQTLLQML